MEEETITLTQAELDAKINEAVETATTNLVSKHNSDMAKLRKENSDLRNANKTQEQLKQEQDEALTNELNDLRSFKKNTILGEKLAKEGLPSYFKNDIRLRDAEEGDLDKAIKEVKKEYEATLPKGNPNTNVIQQGGSISPSGNKTPEEIANEKMGEFLNDILK